MDWQRVEKRREGVRQKVMDDRIKNWVEELIGIRGIFESNVED